VYDALTSYRIYKPKYSHEKAVSIITEGSGSHFDPALVRAFLKLEQQFMTVNRRFEDDPNTEDSEFLPMTRPVAPAAPLMQTS
jgi:putative two-component system response regulator